MLRLSATTVLWCLTKSVRKKYYYIFLIESHVKIFKNSVKVDCQDWTMQGNISEDGMYWLDPDGGSHSNAFLGYCDMTSYNGGWTMCYTTDEFAKPSTEVEYNATFLYGTDGYRTNCNQIKVSAFSESIKNPFSSW